MHAHGALVARVMAVVVAAVRVRRAAIRGVRAGRIRANGRLANRLFNHDWFAIRGRSAVVIARRAVVVAIVMAAMIVATMAAGTIATAARLRAA
jgi:hypothetical protein